MAVRGNQNSITTVFTSAPRTETTNSTDRRNDDNRGVRVRINTSAVTATGSVVFKVQGKTPAGAYEDILSGVAVTAAGDSVLTVYPGLVAVANSVANAIVPRRWRVVATHANAVSVTYSASAELFV